MIMAILLPLVNSAGAAAPSQCALRPNGQQRAANEVWSGRASKSL
jgi:hypothetical protein